MNEQLIEFETAKLAKEKGFNEGCRTYYEKALTESIHEEDGTSGPFGWELGELNRQSGYFENNHKFIDISNEAWFLCSAPTQSLLHQWVREVHNLYISIHIGYGDPIWYSYFIQSTNNDSVFINAETSWGKYEQALEAGLQQVLKYIINEK